MVWDTLNQHARRKGTWNGSFAGDGFVALIDEISLRPMRTANDSDAFAVVWPIS